MKLREKLSNWVITQIKSQNPEISETKVAELEYGFLAFYLTVTKCIIIIAIALTLGVLPELMTVFVTFMFVRSFAGGIHAETSLMCLISTSIIYFGVTYLAIYIPIPNYVLITMAIVALLIFIKYAPADVANKPIRGPKHKIKLKKLAIFFATVFSVVAYFLPPIMSRAIILSIFVESLMITPLAYKITNTLGGEHYEKTIR